MSQHAGSENTPPYGWYDKNKQRREGFVPYLQERLFREVNLEVERVNYDFYDSQQRSSFYNKVAMGEVDVMGITTRNPRLLKVVSFIEEPLVEVNIKIFISKDNPIDYQGWSSLRGKKGAMVGFSYERHFDFYPELAEYVDNNFELVELKSREEAIRQLLAGEIDYWLDSYYIARSLILTGGYQSRISEIDTPLATVPMYMAVSKQSVYHDKVDVLTEKLKQLRESGEYQQIEDRYMQRYLEYYRSEKKVN